MFDISYIAVALLRQSLTQVLLARHPGEVQVAVERGQVVVPSSLEHPAMRVYASL